jgi:tetratricopeptide (TPR) repeat protein
MRVRGFSGAALAVVAIAGPAQAADVPLYRAAPAWVKPAPPIDPASLNDAGPILLVFDQQQRMADGEVVGYVEIATRMASPEVIAQSGTISVPWHPDRGDLIVHRVEIERAGKVIDLLADGKRFTVLRREQQLERQQLSGELTATMAVEGLQIGDVVRLVASVTRREPAMRDGMQAAAPLPALPAKIGYARARFLWPATTDIRWKSHADGATPVLATVGGDRELVVMGPLPKPAELPDDVPQRFRRLPLVEASSYADWQAVSRGFASLYAPVSLAGTPLAAEVARIAAASSDPMTRTAAALQLVQDQVRYQANGMAGGNYMPQTPQQTWSVRYGDCKAKSLMLLSILTELGIEAEAVLAHSELGGALPERLPSPGAFDHVLVRATVAGNILWLDGTSSGARLADLKDRPMLHNVLPLRKEGTTLMPVKPGAPARAMLEAAIDYDQSAGLTLPALVTADMKLRGPAAAMVGLAGTQGSADQQKGMVEELLNGVADRSVAVADFKLSYDPALSEARVTATGLTDTRWRKVDGRYRLVLDRASTLLDFNPDRSKAAWRQIPVATGNAETVAYRTRVRLPAAGRGFTVEGGDASTPFPGMVVTRKAGIDGGWITVDERIERSGVEIAPADLPAARAAAARIRTAALRGVAPADLAPRIADIRAGRQDGRFKPLIAAYSAAIARDPEEAQGYLNRARFLQRVFDRKAALADLDKAIALQSSAELLVERAELHRALGNGAKAQADYLAARALDPSNTVWLRHQVEYEIDQGRKEAGLALIQEHVDAGGQERAAWLSTKADMLVRTGDGEGALATMEEAIAASPGNPDLLNSRCWIRGQLSVQLDDALKDCTRAITLSDGPASVLDSRALIYWRMNKPEEALADLEAALDERPDLAGSLYLRGLIRQRQGQAALAREDLEAAEMIEPLIAAEYKRFGIVP